MKNLKWLAGGIIVVVVVVIGGIFAIHKIEGGTAKPLTLSTVTTTAPADGSSTTAAASSGTPVAVDGTWKVASGSQAGYRIKETLFGVSNTAVGRTTAVSGTITISGTTVNAGSLSVDLTKVTSDRSQRDSQFQSRIMDTSSFPTATFVLTQPIALPTLPANGVAITATATGKLTIHGTTKTVTFPVSAQRSSATIQVNGSIPITFSDYNISNPSGGPATTGDTGTMEFLVNFTHA
ncbi:MAG TPA: YceI family protein [Acidimicrobiales bacterium]|jgi:polyisoprenoid-binding protein YceI|nr:YceI family protein [Acidimicrobiales bacterium]